MSAVIPFVRHKHTTNMDTRGGFTCMVCGHWLYESETEWGDLFVCDPSHPKRFGHMHGTEPLRFCPHCGAMVLSTSEWAELHPKDQGKTVNEIARRFCEKELPDV